jgi:hypothetical protein
MNPALPNLFASLFEFHPRDGHTPKENFLTESFAYLLRTDKIVRNLWLSKLLEKNVEHATCEIRTRQTETDLDLGTSIYPDLFIDGQLSGGEQFAVYCEHKWDSPCDEAQLRKYRKVAESKSARVVFVGANHNQSSSAARCFEDGFCRSFLWEDVFRTLQSVPEKSPVLREFIDFMKTNGLSPGQPLTVERMKAFLQASDFVQSLTSLAHKLHANYSWDTIPSRFMAANYVRDAYGRVGIRFETEAWKPAITVGFLYDERDHRVTFVNREKGIDLLLRIEADPKDTKQIQPVLDILAKKRSRLGESAASVLLKGERGNGNTYSVLIVRECLAEVIGSAKTEAEQLTAIHGRLTTWLQELFKDRQLEKAFKKTPLNSGMK